MAYDDALADRVRKILDGERGVDEKRMFGALVFMVRGNMCCGVTATDLIVRAGPERTSALLKRPHARVFDFTGRPMRGWVVVAPAGLKTPAALTEWVGYGRDFAGSLPPK